MNFAVSSNYSISSYSYVISVAFQRAMASQPKPFLKKGQGKYTKIDYPVLRRSGVYQPPPDTRPMQSPTTPPRREERKPQSQLRYSPSTPPSPAFSRPLPSLAIAPLSIPLETGVMGQRSPYESEYSRTSDSPPRETAFGSSLERRMGESDEGVRDMMSSSPGLPSGRPRTAGTVDSGFPREEIPAVSPMSSSGETRASSMVSFVEDMTCMRIPRDREEAATAASVGEEEVIVEPAEVAVRPTPTPRARDRSIFGNTTAEFERREQLALMEDRRGATPSSLSTSTASSLKEIRKEARELMQRIGEDHGESPRLRMRLPLESAAAAGVGRGTGRRDILEGLTVPRPQRMMNLQLDATVASSATVLSPIENSDGRPRNVIEGDSFEGSQAGSRPGSSSHFRIATSSVDSAAAADQRARRDEILQQRQTQPSLQPDRRRSVEEESEASSGSTAAARHFLLGDRRPLDELRSGRSSDEITRTQQRPRHQTRASQATMRRQPNVVIQEEFSDEESHGEEEETMIVRGRGTETTRGEGGRRDTREMERRERDIKKREERVRLMENQLRDAIAHSDLGDAALRRMKEELQRTFEGKLHELSTAYAAKEEKAREEWRKKEEECRTEKAAVEQMRSDLEKERRLLRKDEAAKVKEWRTKYEEEQKKYAEEKKKNGTETSRRRIVEEKAKKEREEATENAASLKTENDRLRKIIEATQRNRATARGHSAHRAALNRAEDEASSASRRNGQRELDRYGPVMNSLANKENLPSIPSPSASSSAAAVIVPQGILKKNQVRFADTTFTVQPHDESFYEVNHCASEWGISSTYANNLGGKVRVSSPYCGCLVFDYSNGDVRHFTADGSVTFHYYAGSGATQFDFPKDRCQVFYFSDGSLEIFRTGKEITKCVPKGGKIERVETMKSPDGSMYSEIWQDNAMAICKGNQMGEWHEQYQTGKRVTHRHSWVGHSAVALHSNRDLEFIEKNFLVAYFAATKHVELVLNNTKANEIRYRLRPGAAGEIRHIGGTNHQCIQFGL